MNRMLKYFDDELKFRFKVETTYSDRYRYVPKYKLANNEVPVPTGIGMYFRRNLQYSQGKLISFAIIRYFNIQLIAITDIH
jgi:hypothetical protein